jgi:pyridoxamine 5'-phosphate oxidase
MTFDFKNDPLENFLKSISLVQFKGIPEHNAMALSTVSGTVANPKPANRIVLYKGMNQGGFSFFTNYDGRKGRELLQNQNVAATFFWPHIDHQIRIEGYVEKLSEEDSDKYFNSRPRLSQLGAWSSNQSSTINSFQDFQNKLTDIEIRFKGQTVTRPPHWGGFRIVPLEIEFWFGKNGRLHERYIYQRESVNTSWNRFLRSP